MDTPKSGISSATTTAGPVTAKEIEAWLTAYLANLLNVPESKIERTIPFEQFGLDSAAAVAMTGDLARWLGLELDPNVTFEDRTIQALAARIAG
jgi:acyl carrier protein